MIGKTISHYKILALTGKGGMGVVYKAEDINLKRSVALKFLPSSSLYDAEAKKRFINEAQSASALDHPNICTIYEIGEAEDGQLFISMALYEGETLKEKIAKGKISIEEAIDVTLQICIGLDKAHQNNIVHRDIKPANIFITNEGIVKILDFGIAKVKGQTRLTLMGATAGTLEYMSPEQARGGDIDFRTDIWSAGVIMYEMLTGKLPFRGEYDQALIYSILNQSPDLNDIPGKLYPVIKKAIAKSQSERYQNAKGMIEDLMSLKKSKGIKNGNLPSLFPPRKNNLKTKLVLTTIAVCVVLVILYFYLNIPPENKVNIPERKTIVVLPFKNLGSPEDDYFAEGVRDEISNKLSSLSSLGVISRNSADKYAKSNKTSKEIGKELGVNFILAGTIRWAKNKDKESRIRIIPQLVRVSDDTNIWSDAFDRTIDDIFNVQNEIAQNVVDKLGIKIPLGQSITGPPPTQNLEAYDYYLKALKFHYGPSTGANIKTCIKLYEEAIKLDPDYAAAYAQLSIAYHGLFRHYWDRDSLNLKKAAWYLKKAKELNPNIAEIHLAQFFYYIWFTNDNERVFQELKQTLVLQPNNADAMHNISYSYWKKGEFNLAKQCEIKSMQLDPLNARYPQEFGNQYHERRDYITAEIYLKKAIELSPNTSGYYINLAQNYIDWKGNTKLAWQLVKNVTDDEYLEFSPNIFIYLNILDRNYKEALKQLLSSKREYENNGRSYIPNDQMIALVYRFMGKYDLSRKYFDSSRVKLEKIMINLPEDFRFYVSLGICYAGLGEKEMALSEINKGIQLYIHGIVDEKNYQRKIYLAQVYTLLGDYENAFSQIDFLLSNPTGFSVNKLKLDPLYDPLRNLQGYKEMINKYSLKD
ncbi:MAG TPA: protein kinase [Ignavibacteriaceae bacterium]|nr:protein kinase [Ignavibacteriaceae bacterium]